jgi:hypothetical protein
VRRIPWGPSDSARSSRPRVYFGGALGAPTTAAQVEAVHRRGSCGVVLAGVDDFAPGREGSTGQRQARTGGCRCGDSYWRGPVPVGQVAHLWFLWTRRGKYGRGDMTAGWSAQEIVWPLTETEKRKSESAKGSTTGEQSGEALSCRGSGRAPPHATSPHWTDEALRCAAAHFPVTPAAASRRAGASRGPTRAAAGGEFTGATSVRAYVCGKMARPLFDGQVQDQLRGP